MPENCDCEELLAVLVTRYPVNFVVVSSIKSQEWSRTEEDGEKTWSLRVQLQFFCFVSSKVLILPGPQYCC